MLSVSTLSLIDVFITPVANIWMSELKLIDIIVAKHKVYLLLSTLVCMIESP